MNSLREHVAAAGRADWNKVRPVRDDAHTAFVGIEVSLVQSMFAIPLNVG